MNNKGFTIIELEERIADINNYYLYLAKENNDKDMILHWTKVLREYQINLDYLRYTASNGTDLTVKLQPNHVWLSARETNLKGIDFTANMPTEEVFTMPKRDGVNGVVYSTEA